MTDTDLIGIYGQTVVALWPGPGYAVHRLALERADNVVALLLDDRILARFDSAALGAALIALHRAAAAARSISPGAGMEVLP